jgi:hypothetical protein
LFRTLSSLDSTSLVRSSGVDGPASFTKIVGGYRHSGNSVSASLLPLLGL